jgi:sugar phosphate isomerase/epimerase
LDRKKVQPKILCGTTITYPINISSEYTLERALEGIARAGLHYVELVAARGYCEHVSLDTIDDQTINNIENLCVRYGLIPKVLNASTDLTKLSGLHDLKNAAWIAKQLDIKTVVTAVLETETEVGLNRFLDNIENIENILQTYDIILALETARGYLNTGLRGVSLLQKVKAERIKINYDMANVFNRGGSIPEEDLASMGEGIAKYIGHVHLKDKTDWIIGNREFPVFGKGVLDFGAVLTLLWEGGYSGPMTLEVELDGKGGSVVLDQSLEDSYRYLRQFWDEE